MGITELSAIPAPKPNNEVRVYWLTDFEAISPMLFYTANHILAFAFVAEASNMQIPLHIFATDASKRN